MSVRHVFILFHGLVILRTQVVFPKSDEQRARLAASVKKHPPIQSIRKGKLHTFMYDVVVLVWITSIPEIFKQFE